MSKEISLLIKQLRLEKKLSQEKLALKCGVDRKYIHIIEQGNSNISTEILSKICKGLNIKISDFFITLDR